MCLALYSSMRKRCRGMANAAKEELYATAEICFNLFFTFELLVRVLGLGRAYLDDGWNITDAAIVLITWLALLLQSVASDSFMLTIQCLRLLRVLRPLRMLEAIPALRRIVNATLYAVKDLRSTLLIIVFFTFLFGIFLR